MMRTVQKGEIILSIEPNSKRRMRSKQERREVVEETFKPGASVAVIARAHGVNANQVFHWRKLYHQGHLDVKPAPAQLMPVCVRDIVEDKPQTTCQTGAIHIEVGRTRIRVEGCVDSDALRIILEQLSR